ncbi:MAG: HPr family phosphocarrier protein [Firmicutes bacterium]|nr:HPr family phosphocarrier protein [Bacillota bacterium]
MEGERATTDIAINLPTGLHARPAAAFARTAARFRAQVRLKHRGHEADAKSVLEMLALGVEAGATVRVEAWGEDAAEAVSALAALAGCGLRGEGEA